MTDESNAGGVKGTLGGFSTGEMILGLSAAWIFLVVYVIGNRLADDYFNSSVAVPAAMVSLGIVAAIYFYNAGADAQWRSLYPWIALVAAWGIVVLAGLDLLDSIINGFSSSGEFYEITLYIAAGVMGIGAYLVGQEK